MVFLSLSGHAQIHWNIDYLKQLIWDPYSECNSKNSQHHWRCSSVVDSFGARCKCCLVFVISQDEIQCDLLVWVYFDWSVTADQSTTGKGTFQMVPSKTKGKVHVSWIDPDAQRMQPWSSRSCLKSAGRCATGVFGKKTQPPAAEKKKSFYTWKWVVLWNTVRWVKDWKPTRDKPDRHRGGDIW